MIEVSKLTKRYASLPAVNGVSFRAAPGQVTGCIGPNGSGKSTTLKMIVGLVAPTSGTILWRGRETDTTSSGHKRLTGYVPEEAHLYSFLSGQEYLEMVAQLRGMDRRSSERRIERLLSILGLRESGHCVIAEYSKGMKQKLLLSAALMDDPQLVVLDEPFSGLDVASVLVVRHAVHALAEIGKTVLVSAHELSVIESVADRIVILNKGRVVADDTVEGLKRRHDAGTIEEAFCQLTTDAGYAGMAHELVEAMKE